MVCELQQGASRLRRSASLEDCRCLKKEPPQQQVTLLCDWDPARFMFQRTLPQATRTGCPIEIYADCKTGSMVTAKRFPAEQVGDRLRALREAGPEGLALAWPELVLTQCLGAGGTEGSFCRCFGSFCDENGDVLLVIEYLPGGDLFELALSLGSPGLDRQTAALPVIHSLLHAVLRLHARGVAHCDISLENALRRPGPRGEVVLIDFETAVFGNGCRRRGVRGKPSYQAPEMHSHEVWDAFHSDLFACGVAAYCIAIGSYPWRSTKPGLCRRFAFFQKYGFEAFVSKRGIPSESSRLTVGDCLSPYLTRLLEALLNLDPAARRPGVEQLLSPMPPAHTAGA